MPYEPGTDFVILPQAPIGACIGGDCGAPVRSSVPLLQPRSTAARAAYGGAIFGVVSAGLVLGGAIGIAAADHRESERVTRTLWLGTMALSPPIVALTAYLARRQRSGVKGVKSGRRLGWIAYSAAVPNGVLQVYNAFHDESVPVGLTVSGGIFGALCLLPLALDALVSSHGAPTTTPRVRLEPRFSGVGGRF